jgi:hypothetical protein
VLAHHHQSLTVACCTVLFLPRREIGFLSKLNCYWFFCRYFVFAIVTIVALLASPIILWLDPWVWGFPTIYFLVSANVAVVVYLYFTIFSYIFLLFSVVSGTFPAIACAILCLPVAVLLPSVHASKVSCPVTPISCDYCRMC